MSIAINLQMFSGCFFFVCLFFICKYEKDVIFFQAYIVGKVWTGAGSAHKTGTKDLSSTPLPKKKKKKGRK